MDVFLIFVIIFYGTSLGIFLIQIRDELRKQSNLQWRKANNMFIRQEDKP